ncbi:hypothetical protein BCR39DRAFT_262765 [Naematelia encephala]|uniref:Uncharacterized protein n=1 Tax=Naematelia encephala TaxID=71784 RepID=A0A1Y2AVL8_9TREE|nr:hypothetical protein BCR39DRAFT_262765 [Naematelia encephala]
MPALNGRPDINMQRRGCAYHLGDTNGGTYNSDGSKCSVISSEDKIYIAAAAAFCGIVLLGLAVVYIRKYLRSRQSAKVLRHLPERPMSMMGTPLISVNSRFASSLSSLRGDTANFPLSTSPAELDSGSSDSHASSSLLSPSSENFHFPILSADGHLLPPPPASTRRSWLVVSEADASTRPLPSPPLPTSIVSPIPQTPKRFSYQPARSSSPSPERPEDTIGLYPGVEIRQDGSVEILRDDYLESHDTANVPAYRPAASSYHPSVAPQKALFYRSFSAEGEDIVT